MKSVYLDEKFSLWTLMHHSSEVVMAVKEKRIEKCGLSAIELRVLVVITIIEKTKDDKVTASELSRWLFRDRSTVSELLTRMERRGLIQRVPQPDNRKSPVIQITEKGKKLREQAHQEGMVFVNEAMSSITEEERHQLWVIAGKLRNLG